MNKSSDIKDLASALCKAQQEMENAKKTSSNPFFKSKYADLAEVLDTVKPILNKHGLSIAQIPSENNGVVQVETILMHESGQWISGAAGTSVKRVPTDKQLKELFHPIAGSDGASILMESMCTADAQMTGAAISYLRRYSIAAICGIAQEDDDGQSLRQEHVRKDIPMTAKPPETSITQTTLNALSTMIVVRSVTQAEQDTWLARANVTGIDKLTEQQAQKLLTMLENRK